MARRLTRVSFRAVAFALVFASSFVIRNVFAQRAGEPRVEVEPALTSSIEPSALARSLSIELGPTASTVESVAVVRAPGGVLVTVQLATEQRREVVVLDDAAGSSRLRVLALAIAELVRRPGSDAVPAGRAQIAANAPAVAPPPRAPAAPAKRTGVDAALTLDVGARFTTTPSPVLPSARVTSVVATSPGVAFSLAATGTYVEANGVLGQASLGVASLTGGAAARFHALGASLHLGPRLGLGWARGLGSATAQSVASGPVQSMIALAGIGARVHFPESARVFAVVSTGADYVLRGLELRGDDRILIGLSGLLVEGAVGVGIRLSP